MQQRLRPANPRHGTVHDSASDISLGERAVLVACAHIGRGEEGANNRGPWIEKYFAGTGKSAGPWCAAFIGYCLEQATPGGLTWKRATGAKKFARQVESHGGLRVAIEDCERGDIVCWHRGKVGRAADSWKGHVGICVRVEADGVVQVVEGNVGAVPATIRVLTHDLRHERVYRVVRPR